MLRRIAWMIPTFFGITLVVFLAVRAAPGDPSLSFVDAQGSGLQGVVDAHTARFRAEHLLDRSLVRQYLHFVGPFDLGPRGHTLFGGSGLEPWHGVLVFDFGDEYARPGTSVAGELARRALVTTPLALISIVLAYLIAVPLGAWCAARAGRASERGASLVVFFVHTLPTFWTALLLILVFGASGLGWLPVLGTSDPDARTWSFGARALDLVQHAVLPITALTLGSLAYVSRQTRASVLEVLRSDFVRTARASGLSESRILVHHALRNALIPLITLFAAVLPALVGGSVVVESVFGIEGLGKYAYDGLLARDFNVILGTTTISAVLTLCGILVSDVLYAYADPRVRWSR